MDVIEFYTSKGSVSVPIHFAMDLMRWMGIEPLARGYMKGPNAARIISSRSWVRKANIDEGNWERPNGYFLFLCRKLFEILDPIESLEWRPNSKERSDILFPDNAVEFLKTLP